MSEPESRQTIGMAIERFFPEYLDESAEDLRHRLRRTRWPDEVPDSGWNLGTDAGFLRKVCGYWATEFDWRVQIERFTSFPHFRTNISGQEIHFLHVRGKSPASIPLILTHGWPGSFLEFLPIIPLLTEPARLAAPAADSFDVVVPSLPGYGYSGKPGRGITLFAVADLWAALMTELGYERFAAQGGDIGAGVTTALGLRHPNRILGIHLNFIQVPSGHSCPLVPASLKRNETR